MQVEEQKNVDYDEVTLNPPVSESVGVTVADAEGEALSEHDLRTKPRRYWSPKEEERFFEIWGRDNWRLTRHGKNTIYFAQWAEEMKERFDIDVKPEEVQAKVNQTRAKFRQVKKQLTVDSNAIRWKKFDIIDRILKNQYRPENAEPIPQEALENNRDFAAYEVIDTLTPTRQPTPINITCNSSQDVTNSSVNANVNVNANTNANANNHHSLDVSGEGLNESGSMEHENNTETNMVNAVNSILTESPDLFNSHNDSRINYSNELFTDHVEVKREYDEDLKGNDYPNEFQSISYEDRNHYGQSSLEEPQLHQLQTPQQNQNQHQQHNHQPPNQQTYQQYRPEAPTSVSLPTTGVQASTPAVAVHPQHHLQQPIQVQNQSQQPHATYEHSTNSYTNANNSNDAVMVNNQNHFPNSLGGIPPSNPNYNPTVNTNSNQLNNNYMAATNNNPSMQPPRPMSAVGQGPGRKRTRTPSTSTNNMPKMAESIENMYLEEVRKKNCILEEQKVISRKRLELEERKVTLMEQFFPKCLALQEQILEKLNNN